MSDAQSERRNFQAAGGPIDGDDIEVDVDRDGQPTSDLRSGTIAQYQWNAARETFVFIGYDRSAVLRKRQRRRWVALATLLVVISVWVLWHGHDRRLKGRWLMTFGRKPTPAEIEKALEWRSNDVGRVWTFDTDGHGFAGLRRSAGGHSGWRWWTRGDRLFLRRGSASSVVGRLLTTLLSHQPPPRKGSPTEEYRYTVERNGTIRLDFTVDDSPPMFLTRID